MEIKPILLSENATLETVIHKVNEHSASIVVCEDCIGNLDKADSKQELKQVKELHKVSDDIKNHIDEAIDKQSVAVFEKIGKVDNKVDNIDVRVQKLENKDKDKDHKFMEMVRDNFIGSNIKVLFNWLITLSFLAFVAWLIKLY